MKAIVITENGGVDVITSQKIISTVPSGWDEQIAEYGRGYNYPQPTGQTTVFRTGDDADIEVTIFAPIRVANSLKVQNSLTDFLTLGNTNSFGNTNRFTDDLGGQTYTANLIIDNYTGLMWYRVLQSSAVWDDAVDNALAATIGGFNDWFLPSYMQGISIFLNEVGTNGIRYSPFNLGPSIFLATGSTQQLTTTNQILLDVDGSPINTSTKTVARQFMICRKHF